MCCEEIALTLGPRGGASRQDVLVAEDMGASSEEETDFEAWVAHRKAKKKGGKKKRRGGDARTLNGLNRRAGIRNRSYKCNSENPLAPEE